MVYLIRGGSQYKIGLATDPAQRLRELQTGSPVLLELVTIGEGDRHREALLHRRYRKHRQFGEWFAFGPTVLPFVIAAVEGAAIPDDWRAKRNDAMRKAANTRRANGLYPSTGQARASKVKRSWVDPGTL